MSGRSRPGGEPLRGMTRTLVDNIRGMEERRRRERALAPLSDKLAENITAFAGSMAFVVLHLLLYGGWIVTNLGWVPGIAPFDPTFVMLAMEASVEAIFLSTFVLISQNRMMAAADRRGDLDLQVNLLTEHELTRLAALVESIASRLGIQQSDPEFEEVKKDISADKVLDVLDAEQGKAPPREPDGDAMDARPT